MVTPKQMQELERRTDAAGVSYWQMMYNAGSALAECILSHTKETDSILFLAGTGNNGGDCYTAASLLAGKRNCAVLAPFGKPGTEISQKAAALAKQIPHADESFLQKADAVVDGLFGTGFHGDLPPEAARLLSVHRKGQLRIACDIPSGGSGGTGAAAAGTFQADLTLTFGAEKLGLRMYPLRNFCGEICTADIGIPTDAFEALDPPATERLTLERAHSVLPPRRPDAYKNLHGHLLSVTGSVRMRGACVLASGGAMRSGTGLLTAASAEPALGAVSIRYPEAMCLPLYTDEKGFFRYEENLPLLGDALCGKSALLIGCGMGCTEETQKLTKFLLKNSECPIILDADGLNAIAGCIEWIPRGRTILTPHPAEAARLLGITAAQVQADRLSAVRELASRTGTVTVLKGAGTLVSDGVRTAICCFGNAGMARAGSGDVLAGITASLTAQGLSLYDAACTAVTVHAAAGDAVRLPHRFMLPQDLIEALQEVL